MEPVPSHWPPAESESEKRVYPLFLLPQVLVPYGLLELVIFEPRYLQMMEDVLDGPGRIVLGNADEGVSLAGSPPFHPVAGLGEIGRHDRLEDGRYRIVLVGLRRVLVEEVQSDRLYRKVSTETAPEIPVPSEREPDLRQKLVAAIRERTPPPPLSPKERAKLNAALKRKGRPELPEEPPEIPPNVPVSSLADLLLLRMPLPYGIRRGLYAELDAEKRARAALAQHAVLPPTPPEPPADPQPDATG